MTKAVVLPGNPAPLGATATAAGVNFSVFSRGATRVELLLFEFRPRSLVPVALGSVAAAGMRVILDGAHPVFPMPDVQAPPLGALAFYVALGGIVGIAAAGVTRVVYAIEDAFERLPIHWMWWPAIGAIAVGVVGYFEPRTLGVGYDNISALISNQWTAGAIVVFCGLKFCSWSISLVAHVTQHEKHMRARMPSDCSCVNVSFRRP